MPDWRQHIHLEPPTGWLNDPNGLCYSGGQYHVFFQYCPTVADGSGPKCWGHWQSPDLLHWQFTGTPLRPDTPWDANGAYSGCALPTPQGMALFYTGNVKEPGQHDYIHSGRQGNTLRVDTVDGIHTGPKQLLLTNADYPADCTCHVRDPKVWAEGDGYTMVLGARSQQDAGRVLVYRSADALHWNYERTIELYEPFGYMWECPDAFVLDGVSYLSVSPQGLPHSRERWQNIYQSGYFTMPGGLHAADPQDFTEWDTGFDFYAPQTFLAPDGRRILIGWMGVPDAPYHNPTAALGWQHCLTLPRELHGEGTRILQRPARELQALCEAPVTLADGSCTMQTLPLRLQAAPEGDLELTLAGGLTLRCDRAEGLVTLHFDGLQLGAGRAERHARLAPGTPLTVDLWADTSSLECYLCGGAVVLSTRFYPDERSIPVAVRGAAVQCSALRSMSFDREDVSARLDPEGKLPL